MIGKPVKRAHKAGDRTRSGIKSFFVMLGVFELQKMLSGRAFCLSKGFIRRY